MPTMFSHLPQCACALLGFCAIALLRYRAMPMTFAQHRGSRNCLAGARHQSAGSALRARCWRRALASASPRPHGHGGEERYALCRWHAQRRDRLATASPSIDVRERPARARDRHALRRFALCGPRGSFSRQSGGTLTLPPGPCPTGPLCAGSTWRHARMRVGTCAHVSALPHALVSG